VNLRKLPRRAAFGVLTLPLISACGQAGSSSGGGGNTMGAGAGGNGVGSGGYQAVVPGTDLAVGRNRFVLGLLQVKKGQDPARVTDGQINLRYYFPIEPKPVAKGEGTAQFRFVDDKNKGLWVAQAQFDQPGVWGVEVSGTTPDGQAVGPIGVQFQVKPRPDTPAIGAPAPRSRNLTKYDVDDIRKIDSGVTPNDMHELSIAQAIEQQKPLVVLFASPGFCVTQTCAPELGEVQKLKAKYGQSANFIHVEIYKDPMTRTPYETVKEWGLLSEPWVFMVDRTGMIADKFEGPAPFSELEPSLQKIL
jgi:hypothetical protein